MSVQAEKTEDEHGDDHEADEVDYAVHGVILFRHNPFEGVCGINYRLLERAGSEVVPVIGAVCAKRCSG
jgi:hypothetical protein